jgi:dTDP-4-dehydrorhamnose reductase
MKGFRVKREMTGFSDNPIKTINIIHLFKKKCTFAMMKLLITGANGQLGKHFRELSNNSSDIFLFTDIAELDITKHNAVFDFFEKNTPNVLINCAAYTAVDKAESDLARAYLINRDAVQLLADACRRFKCFFIHISTDYVFDGNVEKILTENSPINPQSVYGKSKLAGEQLLENLERYLIIRTSWLYSDFGNNFVATMQHLGKTRSEINVVADQFGTPTYAGDLATAILQIINKITQHSTLPYSSNIFHFSNEGQCSWCTFAMEIMKLSSLNCQVNPVTTTEYPTAAKRPHFSVMDKSKIKQTFGITIRDWQDALQDMIEKTKNSI